MQIVVLMGFPIGTFDISDGSDGKKRIGFNMGASIDKQFTETGEEEAFTPCPVFFEGSQREVEAVKTVLEKADVISVVGLLGGGFTHPDMPFVITPIVALKVVDVKAECRQLSRLEREWIKEKKKCKK